MKKISLYILLLTLFMLVFNSCMLFEDDVSPVFLENPQLVDETSSTFSKGLGSQATIKINVEDNNGIDEIALFKSKESSPFLKLLEKSNRSKINDVFSFNLPPSDNIYNIFVRVIDTNGNAVMKEVTLSNKNVPASFNTKDDVKPSLIQDPYIEKSELKNNNDYIIFRLEDQGFGFQSVKVSIADQIIDLKISDQKNSNSFVIEEKNYWRESGVAYIENRFPPGDYNMRITATDKKNNQFSDVKKLEVSPDYDLSDVLEVDLNYKKNVLPNEVYTLTVIATSMNYVKEILVDDREIYPKDGLTKTHVIARENKKAPGSVQDLPITHNIEVSTFLTNSTTNYTAEIFVKEDQMPEYEYFNVYKIDGENLIPYDEAEIYENDKILVDFKVYDDIALEKVFLRYGENKSKEYNTFQKEISSNNYNEFYKGEETIIVDYNNFPIELEVIDKSGNKLDYNSDNNLKKEISIKDESLPVIDEVNIIDGNRKITGSKTFKVAKNNEVFFNVSIKRKQALISSVNIYIKDSSGNVTSTLNTEPSSNPFVFNTINGYPVPDTNSIFFDIEVEDVEGNNVLKENYELMIFDNEEDIYVPKITTNDFSKIIVPGNEIGPFSASFTDDESLKNIYIQIKKKNIDGSTSSILNEEGNIDLGTIVSDGSDENPLRLKRASLSLNNWIPKEDGEYIVEFYAKNIQNYNTKLQVDLEVRDISVELINPPDQNAYLYGGNIDIQVNTIQNSNNKLIIVYDSNNNGLYEETEITYTENYEEIPPDGIIEDRLITANYSIFPNVGNYKIMIEREYAGFETSDQVFITLEDFDDFEFSRNGVIFTSDVGINNSVDSGEYKPDNDRYYIPITYDGQNQSQIDLQLTIKGYSLIDTVSVNVNGNSYQMNHISTNTPDNFEKREFVYETSIDKEDIDIENNNIIITMESYFSDDFNNETQTSLNLIAIGLNKPRVKNFNFNISDNTSEFILNEENYESQEDEIIFEQGTTYQLVLSNILFEDDYKLSEVHYYWRNKSNNQIIPINDFNFSGSPLVSTSPTDFGGSSFDFNAPVEQGTYEFVMELRNGNYEVIDNSSLSSYMDTIKEYNNTKIIIDSQVLQFLDMIANIVHTKDNINNEGIGVIPSSTYDIDLIIQNSEFLNEKSFNAYIDQLGKTYNLSINSVINAGKNDTQKNYTVQVNIPTNVLDGYADLRVTFENTKGETFETTDKVILDKKTAYALPKPYYENETNSIYLYLNKELIENDIKNIYFEVEGYGVIGKDYLDKEVTSSEIIYSYRLDEFYPGITYNIRALIRDMNSNIFIGDKQEISVQTNKTVIKGLNNLGVYKDILAIDDSDEIIVYDNNEFDYIKLESNDGNMIFGALNEKEYVTDVSTISSSNDLTLTVRDTIGNKSIFNFDFYKYSDSINPNLVYDDMLIYSNKNTGIYPLEVFFDTGNKLRSVSVYSNKFTNILEPIYMNRTAEDNTYDLILPKLEEGLSEKVTLTASMIDISGYTEEINIDIEVDTKAPSFTSFSLSGAATQVDNNYEVAYLDVDSLELSWIIAEDNISDSSGEVFVVVNNNFYEITSSKKDNNYSFNDVDLFVDNEYEVYIYSKDSVGNFNTSEKIIIKVVE